MSETLASGATAGSTPYFPMERAAGCPFDPPSALRSTVADRPISRVRIWDGSEPWIVTGHAEQRALLSDPRVSVDDRLPNFPHWNEGIATMAPQRPDSVFNTDPPVHSRLRRMMTAPFTVKRVQAMRPVVERIAGELLDAMTQGPAPADLVSSFALPLPTLMISDILGVPYDDHEFIQHHATVGVDRYATAEQSMQSFAAQVEYLVGLVEQRVAEPQDDVISDFAKRVAAEEITVSEAAQMGLGLLIAGHETSSNMIGLGVLALLQDPEQLAVLRDAEDPAVVAGAVEELLRYLGIIHNGQRRIAKEDIEVGGTAIRAGEGIIIELATANRDPRTFVEPDELDLGRSARDHHAFGYGIHQCIGQQLARVELQVVFGMLFKRIPTLRLATTVDEVEFKHDRLAYGVYELPVTW
ncbi:cytochrome P450 [Saccharopolyspora sp. HNM0983]|uniref:Cytochrome P450 n=1 Tax=Saccharopolyspora montiporae TaxID=2781240 RepID=A0A929B903_9PSEU|nr:cytochrome P450 [Saccharopolyspora sp. HNM0983]MBE9373272.1 cytochrome P450 [Saccharopolyspora sp. HNM0983]